MKFVQHLGMEKIKSNTKPNKVIRVGECVCGFIYLAGVIFNMHMNICVSVSKQLTLKLEVLSCSQLIALIYYS